MSKRVADLLVEALPAANVKDRYGIVGDTFAHANDRCERGAPRHMSRSESKGGRRAAEDRHPLSNHLADQAPLHDQINIAKELAMRQLDRLSSTASDTSENRVGSFALGCFGLLCAMAVGFVSALRPPVSNSVDYGYDERLEAQAPSLSGAKLVSNCSDKGAAMDSLDELRAGAITARGGPPSTAKLQNQAIGGHLVE